MLQITQEGKIILTRGDTGVINVSITNQLTKEPYVVRSGDQVMLSIRKKITSETKLLEKIADSDCVIHISPTDTDDWEFGMYVYDIQLTTLEGDIFTVVTPKPFEIAPEVSY